MRWPAPGPGALPLFSAVPTVPIGKHPIEDAGGDPEDQDSPCVLVFRCFRPSIAVAPPTLLSRCQRPVTSIPGRLLSNEGFRLQSGEHAPFEPHRLDDAEDMVFGLHIRASEALGPCLTIAGLTGIGGGIARDLLLAHVPMVLRTEVYAVAALAGAAVVVIGTTLGLPSAATMAVGAIVCFTLRMLAVRRGWQLPVAGGRRSKKADESGPNA